MTKLPATPALVPTLYTGDIEYSVSLETSYFWMIGDLITSQESFKPDTPAKKQPQITQGYVRGIKGPAASAHTLYMQTTNGKSVELKTERMGSTFRKVRTDEAERNQDALSLIRFAVKTALFHLQHSNMIPTARLLKHYDVTRVPAFLQDRIIDQTIQNIEAQLSNIVSDPTVIEDTVKELRLTLTNDYYNSVGIHKISGWKDILHLAEIGWISQDTASGLSLMTTVDD